MTVKTQTAQVIALYFDLIPEECREQTARELILPLHSAETVIKKGMRTLVKRKPVWRGRMQPET